MQQMAYKPLNIGSSGYNCKFASEPPDSYICKICTVVAKDPQQMDCCGKIYCTLCLTEHKKQSNKCPQCRKAGNSFNDKRIELEIQALKVKCDNLVNGCPWDGKLLSLEGHVENCNYGLIPCPNECKIHNVVMIVLRKDLDNHLANDCPNRQYRCPHCNKLGEIEQSSKHLETCPKVMIQCPNEQCEDKFERSTLALHRYKCTFENVPCKYAELGCEERPLRKDLKTHEEDDTLHLRIVTETVLKLERQLRTKPKEKLTFKLPCFSEKKSNDTEFYSPSFSSSHKGYKLCVRVDVNGYGDGKGTHVSVYVCLMKGDNDDSLTWPFTGTVTIELLNQLEDKNHHTVSFTFQAVNSSSKRVTDGEKGRYFGYSVFINQSALGHNSTKNCQYLKDDVLFFRVSVDEPNYKPWLVCTDT